MPARLVALELGHRAPGGGRVAGRRGAPPPAGAWGGRPRRAADRPALVRPPPRPITQPPATELLTSAPLRERRDRRLDPPANMEPLRIAVVGCGAVAQLNHLPALASSRHAKAAVLVDRDLARAQQQARRWGVSRAVTDVAEMGEVDAAIVALPNHLHAPVTIDLLRRGIPVLVDKPLEPTAGDCDAMITAADEARVPLAVGLEFRFFDSPATVRELLDAELVGPLTGFDLRQGVIPRWPCATDFMLRKETAGGGGVADFRGHLLELLLCWLGDWREVACADDALGGLESDAELQLTFASGVTGTVEVSRTRNLRNTCRFTGERGALEVGIWDPDPVITLHLPDRDVELRAPP